MAKLSRGQTIVVAAGLGAVGLLLFGKGVQVMATTGLAFRDGLPIGPITLKTVGVSSTGVIVQAAEDVANDALRMIADAKFQAGLDLRPVSGFRSMEKQTVLYAAAVAKGAARFAAGLQSTAAPYPPTAKPGHSNHQAGTALDWDVGMSIVGTDAINAAIKAGQTTPIFRWLEANAATYGFKRLKSEVWHYSRDGR